MSDGLSVGSKLKRAVPLGPGNRSSVRLPHSAESDTAVRGAADTVILKTATPLPIFIRVDETPLVPGWDARWKGRDAALRVMLRLAMREAPAWLASMIVHMVTLMAMATVVVNSPTRYKVPQRTIVMQQPEEKQKIEEVAEDLPDAVSPNTLDEDVPVKPTTVEPRSVAERTALAAGEAMASAEPAVDAGIGLGAGIGPGPAGSEGGSVLGLPNSVGDLLALTSSRPASGLGTGIDRIGRGRGASSGLGSGGNGSCSPAFRGRKLSGNLKQLLPEGADAVSENSVRKALRWLANHQLPDGSWSFDHSAAPNCHGACRDPGKLTDARNAATALALLPFLGSNNTHKESRNYRATVANGLQYLVRHMKVGPNGGDLSDPEPAGMYSHGLAAIALCEAYGMTHDRNLLKPARQSLEHICWAQDPKGGGWRYQPRQAGDASVVGWQLMALKSGMMAGIEVPNIEFTVYKANSFLDSVQIEGGAKYGYLTPGEGDATTAIGLLCRMYSGWKKDNPVLQRGVQLLSRRGASPGNMYYNYYATQVMHHWQGELWQNWNRQMRDQLTHAQARHGHEDGSWFSGSGDLGAPTGGRLYCTAMATMVLEVYYRHMPLYREQSIDDDFPE
ncbi:MAG: hypothetical protein ABFC96_09765 [Thermoguttaceae bacterium]